MRDAVRTADEIKLQTYTPDWMDGSFDAKPGADWMKSEDVLGVVAFIDGFLHAHAAMLVSQGVHPKIVDAVNQFRKKLDAL